MLCKDSSCVLFLHFFAKPLGLEGRLGDISRFTIEANINIVKQLHSNKKKKERKRTAKKLFAGSGIAATILQLSCTVVLSR